MNSGLVWPSVEVFFVSAGAAVGYFVGGFDGFLRVLLAFVILDYFTALALAIKQKRLSSDVGFWGIFKKILVFAVVALANLIDNEIGYTGDMLRTAVVFFYLANEGLSVLEHCAALGLLIPEGVRVALLKIRENKDKNGSAAVLEIKMDQVEDVYKLAQILKPGQELEAVAVPVTKGGAVLTNAMLDELTDGRCAGGSLEQRACGIQTNKS